MPPGRRRCHWRDGRGAHSDVSQTRDLGPYCPVTATGSQCHLLATIHLRQQADGRMLVGESWAMEAEDTDLSLARGQGILERAASFLPELAQAHVETMKLGVRPMPEDELPIVGPAPGISGLYIAVTHSGVTLAPLIGQLVAQEVTSGQPSPLLADYRIERFGYSPRHSPPHSSSRTANLSLWSFNGGRKGRGARGGRLAAVSALSSCLTHTRLWGLCLDRWVV